MIQSLERRLSEAFLILNVRQSERTTAEEVRLTQQELEQQLDGYRKQGWIWDPFSQGYYKREVSY